MLFGLILTHNLSTVIVAFFSLIYVIFNLEELKETNVKKGLLINTIFIITITSFYWFPFLETRFSSNYQVYEEGMMSTSEETANHGLKLKQLFVTMNDGSYVFELGPHILIMFALSIMAFIMIKSELKEQYMFFIISALISLWMSTKYFPWKFLPNELSIIQFPWRMMMMSAFFLSLICAMNMEVIIKRFNYKDVAVISSISILYIIAFVNILINYDDNITNIENLELGKISGRENEIVSGIAKEEYLPVNAYNNKFYIASREDKICVLEGEALIENEFKDGIKYSAKILILDKNYAVLELPYLYYPGYEVRLDGMKTSIFETSNGFLGIVMYGNDHATLEVNYVGTKVMQISMLISFISFILFIVYIWKKR